MPRRRIVEIRPTVRAGDTWRELRVTGRAPRRVEVLTVEAGGSVVARVHEGMGQGGLVRLAVGQVLRKWAKVA